MTTTMDAPFPGLRPFTRADAPWFFGRTAQIAALRDRLERHRFLAVVGGSGVGKSSLVYAGLMPLLEKETNWCCLEMMPRGAPSEAMARAFVSLLLQVGLIDVDEASSAPLIDHVRTTIRRSALGLVDLVNEWFATGDRRVLILVDQFEEIFRFAPQGDDQSSSEDEAAPFVSSLLNAAAARAVPVHVVLTMRADYIGDCVRFEGLPEAVSEGQYLVPRLTREEIESVIRQPIRRAGAVIEHDLVEQLLNDCASQADALPILQHVLMRLWDEGVPVPDGHRRLTIDTYIAVGRMRDALSRHADSVIDELGTTTLGKKADGLVAQVMRALTEVDHKGRGIRRPIAFGQLIEETGFGEPEVALVVDAMRSDGRSFLRPGRQVRLTDEAIVDIGHEALIRLWRRIEDRDSIDHAGRSRGWLRAEERDGRIYRALLEYAEESERGDGAPLPPGQAESRLAWWNEQKRTERWARRYGGGWALVVRLIERSVSAGRPNRSGVATSAEVPALAESVDEINARAKDSIAILRGQCSDKDLRTAKELVEVLRNHRQYELMGQLAEAISRIDPKDATNRRLYAASLIDTDRATLAIDVLLPLVRRLPEDDPEYAEATGLLGRANRQIFFDAGDKNTKGARRALKAAIEAYREPYERDLSRVWHGLSLVALLSRARALGLHIAPSLDAKSIAAGLVNTIQNTPASERDEWFLPTLIEASLGLGDWDFTERLVKQYLASPTTKAFHVASTLRQFTYVWDLENGVERGRALVELLRASLLQLSGAELRLAPSDLSRARSQPTPQAPSVEAILGGDGRQTFRWWKTGVERASSVAAIRQRLGPRVGTGFLLRAGDLGLEPAEEMLVLTAFHVVNPQGAAPGLSPDDTEVVFEAVEADRTYAVTEIVWSSPPDRHDASLLRLDRPVVGIAPLPIAAALPALGQGARVYIIGHAGGRDLSFSFQDNELLDHEGPPEGRPQMPGVCRLHYRAPTEGGSTGSPVFNSRLWQVIAMHHAGGKLGMPRLNGKPGTYGANEGISIQSIIEAIRA